MTAHQKMKDDIDNTNDILVGTARRNLLNYSVAGHLYSILCYYNPERLREVIQCYKQMNVYPIGSTSYGGRTQQFINIANHELLLKFIMSVSFFIRKIKNLIKV